MGVDTHDSDGYDLLSIASDYSGAVDVVKLLLARGADPKKVGPDDMSPIEHAAARGELDGVRTLLDAGAAIRFAFASATATDDATLMTFLLDHGAPISGADFADGSELMFAVRDRDLARVELLLAHGATVTDRDKLGRTALHWAAIIDAGTPAFVQALLRAGADPTAKTPQGETPEMLAVRHGNRHVVKLLHAR
jgi:ankyrin repeat protein